MNHDEKLQLSVVEQLEWDPSVNSANIGVIVKDGVVTLEGSVPTYVEKYAAVKLTKRINGVKGVADEIQVAPPASFVRSDTDIAQAALQALEWDVVVPHEKIKVIVRGGTVTLEGELDWQYQRRAAEYAVRNLTGVRSVANMITLKTRPSPNDVKTKIEAALKRSAEDDARHIKVKTHDSTVVLEGNVHSWMAREEAEHAAWAAPGIAKVENHILVSAS
jgi:osmotically-inducible protein OsmY